MFIQKSKRKQLVDQDAINIQQLYEFINDQGLRNEMKHSECLAFILNLPWTFGCKKLKYKLIPIQDQAKNLLGIWSNVQSI